MKPFSLIEASLFLKNVPLFRELELDILLAIADKIYQETYEKNDVIFDTNQKANKIYFIGKGKVWLMDEKKENKKILQQEEFFGEEPLFNRLPRTYQAIADEQTLILSLTKSHLLTIISECPSVAIALLESYTKQTKNRHF
jgi:CRP/FNR family transcriptional regulator